ncbi:hypothetical protein ABT143_31355 [Streptomyces sp. NPDC002033]|uniref:hypothetical protein n=1 Tax=unclassified Streptomyces TaxID=2593676 RepID=UPI003330AC08
MTTGLGLLASTAAKWDSMAGELKKIEARYGETVQKIVMGDNWSGVSAGVAQTRFTATRYEYACCVVPMSSSSRSSRSWRAPVTTR